MYDMAVIGAGPAGSYLASLCSGSMDVLVLEEDSKAGNKPCSGLVSERFMGMLPGKVKAKGLVQNRVKIARVHFMGKTFVLRAGTAACVIDRGLLDRRMAEQAQDSGANIVYGEKVTGVKHSADRVSIRTALHGFDASLVAGCDGARSVIASSIGMRPREIVNGLVAHVECEEQPKAVEMWFDKSIVGDGFFWKIPRGREIEYGCMGKGLGFSVLERFFGISDVPKEMRQAAPIPIGPPEKTCSGRIMLVGDAAGQTKPWSGGGLAYGLIAASCAAESAKRALRSGMETLCGYEDSWRKRLMRDIQAGMLVREFYKDLDLDGIAGIVSKVEDAERKGGDIDFDSRISHVMHDHGPRP